MTNDDLERRLREALHHEAERITPNNRRNEILDMAQDKTEILDMAQDKTQTAATGRRWLAPVAAAASVALIGTVIWGVSSNDSSQEAAPAVTQSVTSPAPNASGPAAGPSKAPSAATVPVPNVPPPPPSGSARTGATQVALPVYFVGGVGGTHPDRPIGLYREYVTTSVPVGATAAEKAQAALSVAMKPFPRKSVPQFPLSEGYIQIWTGESVTNVTVTPTRITITLDGPGRVAPAATYAGPVHKFSIQQLVWTAQAAVGQGSIPVRFVTPGSANLFETFPISETYNRPPPSMEYEELAPIWIASPAHAAVGLSGSPVVATGQSCAFEGTTQWQLMKDAKVLKSGFTTATSGCPSRGTWQVKLGVLAAGSYTFRMYEVSQENGKVIADTSKPFTVRQAPHTR
jgi:Immunoglobulin-like domain of bacterial spore germination